jgi:hypothetical protein
LPSTALNLIDKAISNIPTEHAYSQYKEMKSNTTTNKINSSCINQSDTSIINNESMNTSNGKLFFK